MSVGDDTLSDWAPQSDWCIVPGRNARRIAAEAVRLLDDNPTDSIALGYDWFTFTQLLDRPDLKDCTLALIEALFAADPTIPHDVVSERVIRQIEYSLVDESIALYADEADRCVRYVW